MPLILKEFRRCRSKSRVETTTARRWEDRTRSVFIVANASNNSSGLLQVSIVPETAKHQCNAGAGAA